MNKKVLLAAVISIGAFLNINSVFAIQDIYLSETSSNKKIEQFQKIKVGKLKIGFIFDGPSKTNQLKLKDITKEISRHLSPDYNLEFLVETAEGDAKSIKKSSENLLAQDVDFIISMGSLGAKYIVTKNKLEKPVINVFPLESKNIKNLNQLFSQKRIKEDLQAFKNISNFQNLAVVGNKDILGASLKSSILDVEKNTRFITFKSFDDDFKNIDAVYILPLGAKNEENFEKLISYVNLRKIPSFSYNGKTEVLQGVLATYRPMANYSKEGRYIASNLEEILSGVKPENLNEEFSPESGLVINMETAKKIGYSPNWKIRQNAELVYYDGCSDNVLNLKKVIASIEKNNLDLRAKQHELNAVLKDKTLAKLDYMPTLNFTSGYTKIDDKRASSKMGMYAEHTFNFNVGFKQVLFSDKFNTNYKIQKNRSELTMAQKEELGLNLSAEAAITYINLLKLKSAVDVQKNLVENAKTNLKLAHTRRLIGISGPEDVYRWESQIALNQRKLLTMESELKAAKISLNKLLNNKQNDMFRMQNVDCSDEVLITSRGNILDQLDNPQKLNAFGDFLANEAILNSPEIKQINKAIDIKKREANTYIKRHFIPEINLQGRYNNDFQRDFVTGVDPLMDKQSFDLGVYASVPLFEGGKDIVKYKKAKEEAYKLVTDKKKVCSTLEELVRTHLEKTISAYFNIDLANKAKINAEKTYELVQEHYKTGTASVIELIDAQNNLLVADLEAKNAQYDFIIDLIWVQRAIGKVDFSDCDNIWNEWTKKLKYVLNQNEKEQRL